MPVLGQDESAAETQEPIATPLEDLAFPGEQPVAESLEFALTVAPQVYYPSDFAQFAPRNALDLVEEIPGFDVQGGGGGGFQSGGGRGFGEASGNLLINGDRISSKSTSTRDELARIPVGNVERIEVVDGATLDIPGLSGRVANVIVRQTSSISGQYSWRPGYSTGPQGFNLTQGNVSVRGSAGSLNYTIAADMGGFAGGSEGIFLITDEYGVVDNRLYLGTRSFRRPTLTGTFSLALAPEVKANLNLSGNLVRFRSRTTETRDLINPFPPLQERFFSRNNEKAYEIGADIEFPLGSGKLKLIGLESFEDSNFLTESFFDQENLPLRGSQFGRSSQTGERIGRAEYGWQLWGADWQLSGEAAFNRLDQVGSLAFFSPASESFVDFPFPSGSGGVREDRYESILSFGRPIAEGLSLQLQAGGEYSTISQTGSNPNSRTFQRPKGSLKLAWSATDTLDVSLEVARRVGQLSFGDFLASVNLTDDNANDGNNDLRPQQSWETQLELRKNFGSWGNATLRLFDHRIEDLLIIVPVEGGGEARGNLDSAHRYGARLNGTLQLAALGWQGAKLDVTVSVEDSSLLDPVTGVSRRFDGNNTFFYRADLRHDVPSTNWAYGASIDDSNSSVSYRVRERSFTDEPVVSASLFIENKDVLGLTMRFSMANLFNGREINDRTIFDRPRGPDAQVLANEYRETRSGTFFSLSISGSF
jgi:hypothetical protein